MIAANELDREVPRSIEAERAVLGSLLLLSDTCDDVSLILRPSDFFDPAHELLYSNILAMHELGKGLDPVLLTERLKKRGDLEGVGGVSYLTEVACAVPTAAHAEYYAKIVRSKAMLRGSIHAGTDIVRGAYEPSAEPDAVLDKAEQAIYSLRDSQQIGEVVGINEAFRESLERLASIQSGASPGLSTGYADIDKLTSGFQGSQLTVLAARPSMGKSALALNIAENISREGEVVLLVSLEMSKIELADRLLSSLSRVPGKRIKEGVLSHEEREKVLAAAALFSSLPLYAVDSPTQTVGHIAANARRTKRQYGSLGLIIVDYLQLIEADNPRDPREQQVAKIARRLKGLAREMNVPVLVLAQLNRQAESTRDNKPRLSHLRESGSIEQDADVVMFVHREEYYQTNDEDRAKFAGQAEILVAKQRSGPIGDIRMTWLPEFTRFETAAPKNYVESFDSYNGNQEWEPYK